MPAGKDESEKKKTHQNISCTCVGMCAVFQNIKLSSTLSLKVCSVVPVYIGLCVEVKTVCGLPCEDVYCM